MSVRVEESDGLLLALRPAPLVWLKPYWEAWKEDWRMAIAVGETQEEAIGKWYWSYVDEA